MTDFQVVPDDVDTFSAALRDLAGQAGAAGTHVTRWFNLPDAHTGIFVEVKGIVEHIRQNLEDNYKHLQTLADSSATELAKAAQHSPTFWRLETHFAPEGPCIEENRDIPRYRCHRGSNRMRSYGNVDHAGDNRRHDDNCPSAGDDTASTFDRSTPGIL
ncbi:hypothetical protein [Nocardia kruczakiae]|uniref:hypothetical protein n=1 Tax=Nocardia kruczakiae TaxID=261477 RepID=UPI000A80F54D|nr:hypothetical protein [Nocardia kruczakiae]